jgi:uncharacterized integral membrane protein
LRTALFIQLTRQGVSGEVTGHDIHVSPDSDRFVHGHVAMHGMIDGMGSTWVWTIVGILLAVVLVIVIAKLLRKP